MLFEHDDRRAASRALYGRQEEADQHRDDRDHDEQFDEGETMPNQTAGADGLHRARTEDEPMPHHGTLPKCFAGP
jgi:hypothetical protein